MLVDLEVFYLGHLKNFYTIQYNTMHTLGMCRIQIFEIRPKLDVAGYQIRPEPKPDIVKWLLHCSVC